jgi:peroxiredoxin Q/BCP
MKGKEHMALDVEDVVPNFKIIDEKNDIFEFNSLHGRYAILYFYPKDDTPGCTIEAMDFTRLIKEFESLDAVVIGISKDSCESHTKFIIDRNLRIKLLSDPQAEVQKIFDVWKLKTYAGKEYMGTERSTFLIDKNGKVLFVWRKVEPENHAKEVLEKLRSLS